MSTTVGEAITIGCINIFISQIADWKEVFMLFDRDEDGVLSFQELQVVMKSMGQRPTGFLDFLS